MTIVVTTATKRGISVVGDRALSSMNSQGIVSVSAIRKVYYSFAANVSLAMWGSAAVPGNDMGGWMSDFVTRISSLDNVETVGLRLASELSQAAIALNLNPSSLRRGVHLAGYVGDLPHIYHVHTGNPVTGQHAPKLYRDFPFEYGGGEAAYRDALARDQRAQLRNGMPTLFGVVAGGLEQLTQQLAADAGVRIPAPTIFGQLAVDRALVRFAANLLAAADNPPSVSEEVDCLAFTLTGLVTDQCGGPKSSSNPPSAPNPHPTHSIS